MEERGRLYTLESGGSADFRHRYYVFVLIEFQYGEDVLFVCIRKSSMFSAERRIFITLDVTDAKILCLIVTLTFERTCLSLFQASGGKTTGAMVSKKDSHTPTSWRGR